MPMSEPCHLFVLFIGCKNAVLDLIPQESIMFAVEAPYYGDGSFRLAGQGGRKEKRRPERL